MSENPHQQEPQTSNPVRIGFGLERLGLWCARSPKRAAILLLLTLIIALVGALQVRVENKTSELFRSDRFEFIKFDNVRKSFRESENDIAILIEGDDVLTRDNLEAARSVQLDILLADGVANAFSMFSFYETPDENGNSDPMFPSPLPEGEAFEKFRADLENSKLLSGRMFSKDFTHVLIIVALDPASGISEEDMIKEIRETAEFVTEPLGLKVHLGGVPVLRDFIATAVQRDRIMFNVLGYLIGFFVCIAFLRSFRYALIASIPPVCAVVLSLGIMGYAGIPLNPLSVVLPPLVMVLAFADALHLVFAARYELNQGKSAQEAAIVAVKEVGPACVLTSMTTAIALGAIMITSSELIRGFGAVAAVGACMAFIAVIMITPTLLALFTKPVTKKVDARAPLIDFLERWCGIVADWCGDHARKTVATVVALMLVAGYFAAQIKPHYQLSTYLPDDTIVQATTSRMDNLFGGAYDVLAVVRWQGDGVQDLQKALSAIGKVHQVLEDHPQIANTWSIETLRRWLEPGTTEGGELKLAKFIQSLEKHWFDRLLAPDDNAALIGGRVPDLEAEEIRQLVDKIESEALAQIEGIEGITVDITGVTTLSARESAPMILQLTYGLLVAVAIVMVLLGLAFRSFKAALYSVLPNMLPLLLGTAALHLWTDGLRYESVIALTLAFGIAVDDTIHFLYHLSRNGWDRATTAQSVGFTARRIGPVLAVTTIVLSIGMMVTLISALPSIRGFGEMSILVFILALFADIVLLPAVLRLRKSDKS